MEEKRKTLKKPDAVIQAFKAERLMWVLGIAQTGPKIDEKRYDAVVEEIMEEEVERQMILNEIRKAGPLTIRELSDATDMGPKRILRHIIALRKLGTLTEAGEKGDEYQYKVT